MTTETPLPILEKLAELEHEQWIEWSKTLVENEHAITSARRERWRKLWVPYALLTEEQKEQDRKWARKILEIIDAPEPHRDPSVSDDPEEQLHR